MAYEKFGKWILRILATSLPMSGGGILLANCVFKQNMPLEQMWLFWVLLLLCVSVGCVGAFVVLLGEDVRERTRPKRRRPAKESARDGGEESDPVFTMCGNVEVGESYEIEGITSIHIRCRVGAFDYQGCPENCVYYHVPKPTPGGLIGGAIVGAIAGAVIGGPGGAVAASAVGAGIGGALEAQRIKPVLQQLVDTLERGKKAYQILLEH